MTKNKFIGPSFSEEPTVTGDSFLAVMDNTALCHVHVRTVFQLHGAPTHFSHHVHAFLDREFPDHWVGWVGGGGAHSPGLIPLDCFFWGL
jgi:hypothetical protein